MEAGMHRGMCSPVNSTLSVLVGDSNPGDILVSWHSHPNSRVTKKQEKVIKTKQNILVTHSLHLLGRCTLCFFLRCSLALKNQKTYVCRVAPRSLLCACADHGALWKNHLFQALIEVVSEGQRFQALHCNIARLSWPSLYSFKRD